jgi:conjugative relaxase-like TrwC/TraI family protein
LAEAWNLAGEVKAEHFERLAKGFHPETGAELVRQREGYSHKNERGEIVKAMEHRAGWDATFSAPKSVSLTALVGADEQIREAHWDSVRVALNELETFVQARIGSNHPAETTGKWVVAKFEHDSARPVNGYAAPQLHTHCVFFNVTETTSGETRALQPQELYRSQRYATAVYQSTLAKWLATVQVESRLTSLSEDQGKAVLEILGNRDQVVGLQGTAGAGKTTALAAIRDVAERQGYEVEGFAPTSRATKQLQEAGIRAQTLQHFLAQGQRVDDGIGRVYFVDESSLASTKQVNEFLRRLHDHDRVIFVGDTRQHQGVEAGRPFEQLQQAGMLTARLDHIIRQRNPELKRVVEQLAKGQVREAFHGLAQSGRVQEIKDPESRLDTIARDYVRQPERTLVVSPDNRSRIALNERIHSELQVQDQVSLREHQVKVLLPDNFLTGADREWAGRYEAGHVVRFTKGSRALNLKAGEYVRVIESDPGSNLVTVEKANGKTVSYDPRRLQGVTVYQEAERGFSVGDRIQFTAPYRDKRIANRELGTIHEIRRNGILSIQLDSGRTVEFSMHKHPHLDYGYAVTSHSSQGITADRVLVNVDTRQAHEKLLNSRFAYVSISRARHEAVIYTDNAQAIGIELSREVSKRAALEHKPEQSQTRHTQCAFKQSQDYGLSL